jgi:hypothetical protein
VEITPALVMGMWTGGLAAGGALVARLRVVGPGYSWLAAGVVLLFGALAAGAGGGGLAWVAVAVTVAAAVVARSPASTAIAFGAAAVLFLAAVADDSQLVPLVTGAVFLGGVTSEMMLGHWYLVDPRLPRWALRLLTLVGSAGLVLDFAYLALNGGFDWEDAGTAMGAAFVVLSVTTGLLMLGVWFSLKEEKYTGVMAATGLSYLATLTAVAAAVTGRMVAFGG